MLNSTIARPDLSGLFLPTMPRASRANRQRGLEESQPQQASGHSPASAPLAPSPFFSSGPVVSSDRPRRHPWLLSARDSVLGGRDFDRLDHLPFPKCGNGRRRQAGWRCRLVRHVPISNRNGNLSALGEGSGKRAFLNHQLTQSHPISSLSLSFYQSNAKEQP